MNFVNEIDEMPLLLPQVHIADVRHRARVNRRHGTRATGSVLWLMILIVRSPEWIDFVNEIASLSRFNRSTRLTASSDFVDEITGAWVVNADHCTEIFEHCSGQS